MINYKSFLFGVFALLLTGCNEDDSAYVLPDEEFIPPVVEGNVVSTTFISTFNSENLFDNSRSYSDVESRVERMNAHVDVLDRMMFNNSWSKPVNSLNLIALGSKRVGIMSKLAVNASDSYQGMGFLLKKPCLSQTHHQFDQNLKISDVTCAFSDKIPMRVGYFNVTEVNRSELTATSAATLLSDETNSAYVLYGVVTKTLYEGFVKKFQEKAPKAKVIKLESKVDTKTMYGVVLTSDKFIARRALEYKVGENDDIKCFNVQIEYQP